MKESNYNFLIEHTEESDQYLLFNGLTKALLVLNEDEKDKVEQILKYPNSADVDQSLKSALRDYEFLVEDKTDEIKLIKHKYLCEMYDNTSLNLTVIPTLWCNFNCFYCYQNHSRDFYNQDHRGSALMDIDKTRIYNLIQKKIKSGIHSIQIKWYGGEPTLAIDDIIEMTQKIGCICEENNVKLTVSMTTNGYLLHLKNVQRLLPYLKSVTITVDGSEETHNQRRTIPDGNSYETIINNICDIQELSKNIAINLRITLDKIIVDTVPVLLDDLKRRGLRKLNFHFRSLYSDPEKYPEMFNMTFGNEEFAKVFVSLIREAMNRDLISTFSPVPVSFSRCNAAARNSYVIMPDGKLHKCWGEIGLKQAEVGKISDDGEEVLDPKIVEWFTYSPLDKPDCVKCKFLPICMGGCHYNDVMSKLKDDCLKRSNAGCTVLKYNFNEILSLYAKLLEKR